MTEYKFYQADRCGLVNTGFEILGVWDGKDMPLKDWIKLVQGCKEALEYILANELESSLAYKSALNALHKSSEERKP